MKILPKCLSLGLVAFLAVTATNIAHAQRFTGRASAPVMRAFPHSGFHSTARSFQPGVRSVHRADIANGSFGATGTFGDFGLVPGTGLNQNLQNLLNSVPGLGFDFSHLAVANFNLATKALIDPATQAELALALRVAQVTPSAGYFPFFADSYPVAFVPGAEEGQQPQQQQPQVIVVQAPPANSTTAQQQSEAAPSQPPLPDVGSFTLVLRNGSQISAVAFTRQDNRLVYIANDGTRHSIALSDVDESATQQINEEKGTPLHVPLS